MSRFPDAEEGSILDGINRLGDLVANCYQPPRKRRMSFDPKCRELAEHFMQDRPTVEGEREEATDQLAQHIQYAVEAWLSNDE